MIYSKKSRYNDTKKYTYKAAAGSHDLHQLFSNVKYQREISEIIPNWHYKNIEDDSALIRLKVPFLLGKSIFAVCFFKGFHTDMYYKRDMPIIMLVYQTSDYNQFARKQNQTDGTNLLKTIRATRFDFKQEVCVQRYLDCFKCSYKMLCAQHPMYKLHDGNLN